ncbi:MAG: thermonuclease family protein [Candidatus Poribacteria bacterium]|nr:thermonuclease family protein [Candidatus Poribacteria bacterium]
MQLYLVTEVIDGDTFKVDPPISRNFVLQTPMQRLRGDTLAETPMQRLETPNVLTKVRLANINAPEIQTLPGKLATTYLKGLIERKQVTLKPTGISYDRVVADVWLYPNKLFVNAAMVYKGYARRA